MRGRTLMTAAHQENNREMANFAYQLWLHELIDDVVIYPTAFLMGKLCTRKIAFRTGYRKEWGGAHDSKDS